MTIEQLIAQLRSQTEALSLEREPHEQTIGRIRADLVAAGNADPDHRQAGRVREATAAIRTIDGKIRSVTDRIEHLQTEQARDDAVTAAQRQSVSTGVSRSGADATYRAGGGTTASRDGYNIERDRRGERSFFVDLYNAERGDVGARSRIAAHEAETRATVTSSYAGLVPPQYLTEQAALVMRAGRPFASSVQRMELPEQGTSLIVPRSTTGASAAVQAAENTPVSQTDQVWGNLTLPVATVAGSATVSRQSLEHGVPGLDQLIIADLATAYAVAVDNQGISGTGTSGQVLGALNTAGYASVTAFTAAVTIATFWSKLAGLISSITSSRFLPPTHVAMHPRRYAWLCAQVDSSGRPLVVPSFNNPGAAMGEGDPQYGQGPGMIAGLQIVVDANLPAAVGSGPEDQVIVYRANDIMIFEDGDGTPTNLRFEQTGGNSLTVVLVAYGYMAFTAGRYPSSYGVMGGNSAAGFGLVTPTF